MRGAQLRRNPRFTPTYSVKHVNQRQRLAEAESDADYELYVRPDDRWEANDVAALCPDVVESLTGIVDGAAWQLQEGGPASIQWQPESLRTSID